MKKSRSKFFLIMIFVILVFSSSVIFYKGIISLVENNLTLTSEAFKEQQFNTVWASLHNIMEQAEDGVTEVSLKIEEDILNLPEDKLSQLHDDMNNSIHNTDLHNILMNRIKNHNLNDIHNHRNGIVVMTTKGYIEDSNYRRASQHSTNENDDLFRDWESNINTSFNKELEENAIDKLLNRTSGIIALESYDLVNNENHIKIKEMTYDSLLEVFLKEGMEGLRNYQIFVPYYITDIGDIFGTPDILHGTMVDNHKITVVQEFNLYDQLSNQEELFTNEQVDKLKDRYIELLNYLYYFGMGLASAVFGLILFFCVIYNDMMELYDDEENQQEENKAPISDEMQKQNQSAL